ncbi:hypothetical protein Clacol_003592 [Clathrus columnatus]|uniref:C2 domain-containing protein n=1 Tax=Clathrus columnatus TaxID=1419009 RepID=A0AAV5ABR6_9AGAM|nr:hypothetical protein Clacol_003592 [Clathrus columnatus]
MTSRASFDSFASSRLSQLRITDDDVYNYLAHLLQSKSQEVGSTVNGEAKETKDHLKSIQNSIFSFADLIKDVGRDGGSRSSKFPEKLIKVLEARMQNIAMGRDPAYSDQYTRRTIAIFYGSFKDDTFKKQMKENRKIEELILMFATTSTNALKRDPQLADDGWKFELNNQVGYFIRILQDCIKTLHPSPELTSRLDMYASKLSPQSPRESLYDSPSVKVGEPSSPPVNISDMTLVKTVATLFGKSQQDVQRDINVMRKVCTEKNINAGVAFPGRREDFESESAYHTWKTTETTQLSQLMVFMIQFNPELAKSNPGDSISISSMSTPTTRPDSLYSLPGGSGLSSRPGSISNRHSLGSVNVLDSMAETVREDDEIPVGHNFTFIPSNPKKFYKRLVERCVEADLEAMASLPEDQEVSLGILSARNLEVLNECALRWRIPQSYRVTCFLDIVRYMYEREEVPVECIPEAMQLIQRTLQETDISRWSKGDVEYLSTVYKALFDFFLGSIYHSLDSLFTLKRDDIALPLSILDQICNGPIFDRLGVDLKAQIDVLADRVQINSVHEYTERSNEMNSQPGVNRALPILFMSDELEKRAKLLDKRFPEPLLGQLDLVSLIIETQIPLFLTDIENARSRLWEGSKNDPTPDVPIEDIFSLYRRTKTIIAMYTAFCPKNPPPSFDIPNFFEPYVRVWLRNTGDKTKQWVENAIKADNFQVEGSEGHSSSIIDLFDSLRSTVNFLLDLEWPDEYQEARFFTALAKVEFYATKALELYCNTMEDLFMEDLYQHKPDPQPQKPSAAWLEKAKQTIQGEKKATPFNFTPESCVKLNNIESARNLLDQIYNTMQADKISATLLEHGPPVPEKTERERFLFTIKVVMAEGLVPLDSSPSSKLDSYVKVTDQNAVTLGKTRTIYETNDPRWDQTIDLSVDSPLWVMVSVRDRSLLGKHDTVGRAYLCLDPQIFGDYLTHDLWLDLDSAGRVLVRVSMEGEKDDVQFYFGQAFRSLKRAETDMVRGFIDKMGPFVSQCLSRNALKSLVKSVSVLSGLDYNKALNSLDYNKAIGAIYRSFGSSSSEVQIPLPESEKISEKPTPRQRPDELTDVEIEQAISPIFDYFEPNLQVLNNSLGDKSKEVVMERVWKVVLNVVENLLVPPLADTPTDMKPLSDKEVDIVFKWLKVRTAQFKKIILVTDVNHQFLRDYFHANGEGPIPLETLQNPKYREILSIRLYYDWHTDVLMEECVRMMQQRLRVAQPAKRAKSVYALKNLGTIRDKKKERKEEKDKDEINGSEVIMRILRMRSGTLEFIGQQMQILALQAQADREKKTRSSRRQQQFNNRPSNQPELPPMPTSLFAVQFLMLIYRLLFSLFIILNIIRALSLIGLLLVFSSNVVVLADDIKAVNRFVAEGSNNMNMTGPDGTIIDCNLDYIEGSTVPNQPAGVFWAVVNRLLILFQVIVLILSEMNWPQAFFNNYFPVLGKDFGLGALGIFECLIGAAVLSHHVETFAMVSAFFLFSIGCVNIFMGLLFRGKGRYKRSFTAWKDNKPILPSVSDIGRPNIISTGNSFVSAPHSGISEMGEKAKMGFGRQLESYGFGTKGEKAAGLKGFLITKPLETLPRYAAKTHSDTGAPESRSGSPTFTSSATAV